MIFKKEYISKITDIIIPAGAGGEPPASGSRAVEFIVGYLQEQAEYAAEIGDLLEKFPDSSKLGEPLLRQLESEYPEPFRRLVELVYTAYYGDPAIVEKLELPGPPQPKGYTIEPFDATLLEPVKKSQQQP